MAFKTQHPAGTALLQETRRPVRPSLQHDNALVQRARNGDRAAQTDLFRQLRSTVHATLYRVLGSNEQMEDLLQDAFVEIFRSLSRYTGELPLATWAAGTAARLAYRHLRGDVRKAKENRALPARVLRLAYSSSEDRIQHREAVKRLYAVLERLKVEYRVAFALFELDGRSLADVAQIMDVTLPMAKNRITRARSQLRAAARRDSLLANYLGYGLLARNPSE